MPIAGRASRLRLLRCRLLLSERNQESRDGAHGGGADPPHHDAVERNILRQKIVKGGRAKSCGMECICQGKDERDEHGALVDALSPANDAIKERKDDEYDDERIDRHEERHGERDDLRETDVRRAEAEKKSFS